MSTLVNACPGHLATSVCHMIATEIPIPNMLLKKGQSMQNQPAYHDTK
jgi:hypothetical protein